MTSADHISAARNIPIEQVINQRGIKLRGKVERVGPCPLCGGTDRFSINTKKNVFNCRGCDVGGDVIALVQHLDGCDFNAAITTLAGSAPKANGKDTSSSSHKVVVASYEYVDANGAIFLVKDRVQYQNSDGTFILKDGKPDKKFRQRRPDPDHAGKWIFNTDGVPTLIYRLPEVIEAIANDHLVLVVEGEGKADLLSGWNVTATCNPGGAKKWKSEHSEFLRGADVVLVPDNDDPGWKHVHDVGASLVGVAKRIRVLRLPNLKDKGDVIDWAAAGGTREQLDALLNDAPAWMPPTIGKTGEQTTEEKAKAKAREDELLDALAKAEGLEYVRQRNAARQELGVGVTSADIDREVSKRRDTAPLYGHWIVEPWPEPVDGDSLLRDIINRYRRIAVCSHDASLTVALWLMFSWVHDDIAVHSPILLVTSAEPECGKTTTLGFMSFLAPRAIASVDISKAALFRSIQRWSPSFIIDEFDNVLASRNEGQSELKSVINSGHVRGQCVIRCITDDQTPEPFSTFAAKAIGMIGRKMPPATLSRCIIIELQRRTKDEAIERFLHKDDSELNDLRRRLLRWSMDNADTLDAAEVSMPAQFDNRRADNWRVLFSIADLCSSVEDWGDKARIAASKLEGESDATSASIRLLAAFKVIMGDAEDIWSEDLIVKLTADKTSEWSEWGRKSRKPITEAQVASLLKPHHIFPKPVRIDGQQRRGYLRAWFVEAWKRYLPPEEV
jgi:hypothetical protein